MTEPQYVSTAQVARALGVGVTTVKRWVDEGILPAHKTAGGHRKLPLADVLRLVREGSFPHLDLAQLGASPGPTDTAQVATALTTALRQGAAETVRDLLVRAYQGGLAVEHLADQAIATAMTRLGHDWEAGRIDVMHEHRGTQIMAAALYELKAVIETQAAMGNRPVAVGGAPEDDVYLLPSLLAQLVLLDAGWEAVNLGPNTPVASFTRALQELRPRLVWLSVSYLPEPAQFLAEYPPFYTEAERRGVAVAVGGQGLAPEVRSQIRYTTFGDGLTHLAAFAATLHPRPRRPRRGRPPLPGGHN